MDLSPQNPPKHTNKHSLRFINKQKSIFSLLVSEIETRKLFQ
jgi:hypothetical protein